MLLLTILEAAKELRISVATLRRLEKAGKIRFRKIGKKHFFTQEDLDAVVEEAGNDNE